MTLETEVAEVENALAVEPAAELPAEAAGIALGFHTDISNERYHGSAGISKSGLDLIARSPAHYAWSRAHPEQRAASASQAVCTATELGSLFHTAVLEPHLLAQSYALGLKRPDGRPLERRSGADKKAWEQYELEHDGKLICRQHELDGVLRMVDAVRAHPVASKLLDPDEGAVEVSAYWRDPATGVLCRCRPDKVRDRLGLLVDLKSTLEADVGSSSWSSFEKSAAQHRYHVSDAMSTAGWREATGETPRGYVFVSVEKDPPHGIGVYRLDDDARERGRELLSRDLDTYAWCLERDEWPCYPPEIRELSLPRWAFYD